MVFPINNLAILAAPPRRGSASARRYGTSGTQVQISWTINDYSKAKSVIVRYKRTADFGWREEVAPYINGTVVISSLDNTQTYEFQVFIVYKDGSRGMPIGAGQGISIFLLITISTSLHNEIIMLKQQKQFKNKYNIN